MTEDEMKDLVRSLSCDERNALRCFATYGIDEWDKKTTINKEPFVCPSCGGTGLLEVLSHVIERWTAEEMSLLGDGEYRIDESRRWYHEDKGDLYFECVGCERPFDVEELEKMFEVTADEDKMGDQFAQSSPV